MAQRTVNAQFVLADEYDVLVYPGFLRRTVRNRRRARTRIRRSLGFSSSLLRRLAAAHARLARRWLAGTKTEAALPLPACALGRESLSRFS
jgi:hypothetical protein